MNFLIAFIAFDLIVIIHELGHFIVAKLADIKVIEFSLFAGPKLFSFQRGETTYSLRLFPILAYVKLEGEEEDSDSERSLRKKPLWIRASVMAGGPLANLLTAVIALTIVFSATGYATTQVSEVAPGYSAENAGIQKDDIILTYDNKRVYHPMDIYQFMYVSKDKPVELDILRDGKRIKTIIKPLLIPETKRYLFGFGVKEAAGDESTVVKTVYPDTPAEKAGFRENDKIIKLNDTPVANKQEVDDFMKNNGDKPVKVTILRDGSTVVTTATPMVEVTPEQYDMGAAFTVKKGNIIEVISSAVTFTYSSARNVAYSVIWLITGKVSIKQLTGPVGIVNTMGTVVQQSPTASLIILNLLYISAIISIALGATNLLIPFPALDGGQILLVIIEGIRKKPLPVEKQAAISAVGFVILIALAIFTLYNDVLRIFTGG